MIGQAELKLQVTPSTTVGQVCDHLIQRGSSTDPALSQRQSALLPWCLQTRFGLNLDFVCVEDPLL
ncbi:MAG: hypothetical protein ACUVRV_00070 [Cyanobacteriota bacterium]